jgi:hypothetical protein
VGVNGDFDAAVFHGAVITRALFVSCR